MATLRCSRHGYYVDMLRAYRVYCDGRLLGELRRRETKDFAVEPGMHVIVAKIDWCGSAPSRIVVRSGETVELEIASCVDRAPWKHLFLVAFITFLRDRYLEIHRAQGA